MMRWKRKCDSYCFRILSAQCKLLLQDWLCQMASRHGAFLTCLVSIFSLGTGASYQPIPMEQLKFQGVETFVNWSTEQSGRTQCIMVLFHGCNNQGHHWFQKPEEISFLHQALSQKISLVAFTTPRHRGNFCWPSPDESEFQDARGLIGNALVDLLQLKAESSGEQWMASTSSTSVILVGASSGGNFAWESQQSERSLKPRHKASCPRKVTAACLLEQVGHAIQGLRLDSEI